MFAIFQLSASQEVDRACDLLSPALADLTQSFIDSVLDGVGAQTRTGGAQRFVIDVDQMLAHYISIYAPTAVYTRPGLAPEVVTGDGRQGDVSLAVGRLPRNPFCLPQGLEFAIRPTRCAAGLLRLAQSTTPQLPLESLPHADIVGAAASRPPNRLAVLAVSAGVDWRARDWAIDRQRRPHAVPAPVDDP